MKTAFYNNTLTLQREDQCFKAALSINHSSLQELNTDRNNFLHPNEQEHFNTLRYSQRQFSYLLGRYCAKQAIATYTGHSVLTTSCIENGIFQQPITYCPGTPNLQVSISHTNNMGAALAFPEAHPMAIDIETCDSSKINVIETQLTHNEKNILVEYVSATIIPQLWFWTAKEALSKILKCGFMIPFELLEIDTLQMQEHCTRSYFKHFSQYQALSFQFANTICSIVYPRKTQLELDIVGIQKVLKEY